MGNEEVTLLPCPFCGEQAYVDESEAGALVKCLTPNCCEGPYGDFNESEAAAAWNARIIPDQEAFANLGDSEAQFVADGETLNCPACGGSGHSGDVAVAILPLPQAFFDEFGNGADDRVREYAMACVAAAAPKPRNAP